MKFDKEQVKLKYDRSVNRNMYAMHDWIGEA